jgi:FixJ family two-component response regulator
MIDVTSEQGPRERVLEKLDPVVFILDDDQDVCAALGRLLRSAGYRTREFDSAAAFFAVHREVPGCILLDIAMPGQDGFEVQARLHSEGCIHPVIFLTGNGNIQKTVAALKGGAVNFLTKPVEEERLFHAVDEALHIDAEHRGEALLHRAIARRLNTLTPRERQVFELVVRGRLNKQIAADLGTVEKTVKVHRSRVMHKMGAHSLAELVRLAGSVGIPGDSTEWRPTTWTQDQ